MAIRWKEKRKKKFTDLVPLEGKQTLQVKHMEITKPFVNKTNFYPKTNETPEILLKEKILELTKILKQEKNYNEMEKILEIINKISNTIKELRTIN